MQNTQQYTLDPITIAHITVESCDGSVAGIDRLNSPQDDALLCSSGTLCGDALQQDTLSDGEKAKSTSLRSTL